MPWGKLCDGLHSHPKAARAGVSAMGLWVLALSWACDLETGGFVDAACVARWCESRRLGSKLAARLVEAGLWETTGGGYRFHDFAKYNEAYRTEQEDAKSADEARRVRERERKRAVRARTTPQPSADNGATSADVQRKGHGQGADSRARVDSVGRAPAPPAPSPDPSVVGENAGARVVPIRPQPPTGDDGGDTNAILAALKAQPSFAPIANRKFAAHLAGERMSSARPLPWVLAEIARAATTVKREATLVEPRQITQLGNYLATRCATAPNPADLEAAAAQTAVRGRSGSSPPAGREPPKYRELPTEIEMLP